MVMGVARDSALQIGSWRDLGAGGLGGAIWIGRLPKSIMFTLPPEETVHP